MSFILPSPLYSFHPSHPSHHDSPSHYSQQSFDTPSASSSAHNTNHVQSPLEDSGSQEDEPWPEEYWVDDIEKGRSGHGDDEPEGSRSPLREDPYEDNYNHDEDHDGDYDDDEEAAIFERLCREREALNNRNDPGPSASFHFESASQEIVSHQSVEDSPRQPEAYDSQRSSINMQSDEQVDEVVDPQEVGRVKARHFLEQKVVNLIEQLASYHRMSEEEIWQREQKGLEKAAAKNGKRRRVEEDEEEEEEDVEMVDDGENGEDEKIDDVAEAEGEGEEGVEEDAEEGEMSWIDDDEDEDEPGDEAVDEPVEEVYDGGRPRVILKNRKTGNDQVITFPDSPLKYRRKPSSLHRIACILRVWSILYEAIFDRVVITLRDIFYQDKALFKHQRVVDKLVDDTVATAGLKRKDFYVCASAKGLIASSALVVHRCSGDEIVPSATRPTLIDAVEMIDRLEAPDGLQWVLVVEKHAIFQSLCSAGLLEDERLGPGVLVTGKGFPDLATRQLLRLIADTFPTAKIYALVDADPHGLSILSTYMYGSLANSHSAEHAGLPLGDRLEWMGLKASDWARLGVDYDDLLPLEKADVNLAMSMLRKQTTLPLEWKHELSRMLHLNRKAEIEAILGARDAHNHDVDEEGQSGSSSEQRGRRWSASSGVGRLVDYICERMA
ncbi:hypothetical protein IAT38_005618 [Cryptococcus sp. DSM 104549]